MLQWQEGVFSKANQNGAERQCLCKVSCVKAVCYNSGITYTFINVELSCSGFC